MNGPLERAKLNVNENFLLVGILEELEDVLLYWKDFTSLLQGCAQYLQRPRYSICKHFFSVLKVTDFEKGNS